MWHDLGDAYASAGRYAEAIQAYKAASKIDPDWTRPHFSLAWTYHHDLQRYEEAIKEWKQVIEREPNIAGYYLLLGCCYEKNGQIDKAQNCFIKAKDIKPNTANEIFENGNHKYDLGNYKDAIECYRNVIRLDPDRSEAHYGLGKAHLQLGNKDLAMEECVILKTLDEKLANELLELINCPESEPAENQL